jgi:hypothetical protein
MHIFIDESGSFGTIGVGGTVDVVGALIVPDSQLAELERQYNLIRGSLAGENGEVKGRRNDEAAIASVVQLLRRFDVLFELTMMDLSENRIVDVEEHRGIQLRQYGGAIDQLRQRLAAGGPDAPADEDELQSLLSMHRMLES